MHWIVQENLYREDGFQALMAALERFSIPHDVVKVVPFSEDAPPHEQMVPNVEPQGLVMVCGSITLAKLAARRGWTPGSFHNANHDYRVWQQHYGDLLLNAEARVCRYADVERVWETFFIRPVEDTKSFNGQVMDWEGFEEWRRKVIDLREVYTSLDGDTIVSYGPTKTILREARFFVVDGRVVTQSTYRVGSRVVYDSHVDEAMIEFAQRCVDRWAPARAFVIDVALTDEGYRIVEINCLNSAGFYAADVQKLVMAIEDMPYP